MMTNLLTETTQDIHLSGHTLADVFFIGSSDGEYACRWHEFEQLADVEYHSGYGAQEVATDLIVVFRDGKKMWRHEYDGSERWDYDQPGEVDYTKPAAPIAKLVGGMWTSVAEMQEE